MGIDVLRAEGRAFQQAAAEVAVFAPRHRTVGAFTGGRLSLDSGPALDLSGLDYLALGSDPTVKALMAGALTEHDCAIPGSEAVIRTAQVRELEDELARFHLGTGTAITFSAGYAANFALMEALGLRTGSHFLQLHRDAFPPPVSAAVPTVFFLDGDLHFSARHGVRFARRLRPAGCRAVTYRAGEPEHLAELLRRSRRTDGAHALRVIVTDTVESATGREFDMAALCALAESYDCLLYADEAHAVGVLGPQGRGVTAKVPGFERYRDRLIVMGTLTKALCQPGGYAAMTDPSVAALLRFCSPQHVFSAPVAPWVAAATVRILDLVAGPYGEARRRRLADLTSYAHRRLRDAGFEPVSADPTPILAVPLREPRLGERVLEFLARLGYVVSVFQAPLMPVGREVVRIGLRADLAEDDVDGLVEALRRCRKELAFG
ncbi:MAG TPA: aminotransferase class I/II-fold pyridoxal phosphate-dependent enzyme [Micromonospora sp.]